MFVKESSELSCQNRFASNFELAVDTQINHFITSAGNPLMNNMTELEEAVDETSPVLTAFNILKSDSLDKSASTRKFHISTLKNHYRNPFTDTH